MMRRRRPLGINTQQSLGIAVLVFLTWINTRGLRTGAMVQNIFTVAKTGALLGLIALGFLHRQSGSRRAQLHQLLGRMPSWGWLAIQAVGVAMVGSLFSSDAWNNVTFTGEEVRNPKRNLPLGAGARRDRRVSLLYLACNFSYLRPAPASKAFRPRRRTGWARRPSRWCSAPRPSR